MNLSSYFYPDYAQDRAAFERSVFEFAERTRRDLRMHRHWLEDADELCVTAVELPARDPQRLLVLVTGIHGIEGYVGAALCRVLFSDVLRGTDPETDGLLVVHAQNPYGFASFTRVNGNNVDLNRNCALPGEALFASDSSAYAALEPLLSPKSAARVGLLPRSRFYAQLLAARARRGERVVRLASLGGQYIDPHGVFWGGDRLEPETRFFQTLYERLAEQYRELLVVDLHTGYGMRGEAYALFGRADSPAIRACAEQGVTDDEGHDRTYEVRGDLVGYCYAAAKRAMPHGTCNGLALEIGTHALHITAQLSDLYTVVLENQARLYAAEEFSMQVQIRAAFRELFYPSDESWRTRAMLVGARCVEGLLRARGFLRTS